MSDMANPEPNVDATTQLLVEIRDAHREALDRQTRFLWILVPIFAVLCIQTALQLMW